MQTLSKLLQSFWSFVFFGLGTNLNIISFFIIIIIYDIGKIFFRAFKPCFIKSCINFNSKSTKIRVLPFMFLFLKPFFGLFLSFFRDFHAVEGIYELKLLDFWLRLFNPKVFYGSTLDLYLSHSNKNRTMILVDLMIYLSNIENK